MATHDGRLRFTTTQAAEYAEYHVETVRLALASGELHGSQRMNLETGRPKKGGRWSIRRECLDAWLDGARCEHQQRKAS